MDALTDTVAAFFAAEDWPVVESDDGVLETAFEGNTSAWPCRIYVFEADERVVFVSAFPELVPEERRTAVGEFCNRANFGLAVGNFEVDHDGGEVRFRTGVDGEGTTITVEHIRNLVVANVMTMDRYIDGIAAVLRGTAPADAVEDIEDAEASPEG